MGAGLGVRAAVFTGTGPRHKLKKKCAGYSFTTGPSNNKVTGAIIFYSVLLILTLIYTNAFNSDVHKNFTKLGSGFSGTSKFYTNKCPTLHNIL